MGIGTCESLGQCFSDAICGSSCIGGALDSAWSTLIIGGVVFDNVESEGFGRPMADVVSALGISLGV